VGTESLKKNYIFLFTGLLFIVFASFTASIWCPWLTEDIASEKAISYFEKSWENSNDGCYLDCEDCGVIGVKKVFFGQLVSLHYKCGWIGDVIMEKNSDIFINFLGRTN